MSPIELKTCVMSLIVFLMLIGFISPVDFKILLCRPVEFKGQGPLFSSTRSRIERDVIKPFNFRVNWRRN